MSNNYIVYL